MNNSEFISPSVLCSRQGSKGPNHDTVFTVSQILILESGVWFLLKLCFSLKSKTCPSTEHSSSRLVANPHGLAQNLDVQQQTGLMIYTVLRMCLACEDMHQNRLFSNLML